MTEDELLTEPATGLSYRQRGTGASRACVVLLHGVGGDELNLAGLGDALASDALVVLPRGPLTLGPGQYGWFQVTFAATGPVIQESQADSSRQLVTRFLAQLQASHGIAPAKTLIAGFSQGGIISASVALSAPESVAGFGILSGRILPELKPHLASRERLAHLRAFVGHGLQDNKLPVSWAERSERWLQELGVAHETRLHRGGHAVSDPMQADFVAWVRERLA
ncbi:MAG: alpha/beta hydrolase-fold protein [Ramlibacter sp.]